MPSKPTWPIHHEHAGSELHSHPRVSRNALSYCNQNILARKCKLSEWRDTTRSGGRGATTSSHIAPERCWNVTVIWRSSFIHRRTTLSKKNNKVHSINLQSVCNSWPVRCVEEHRTLLVMFMLLCRLFKGTLRSFYCIVLLLRSDVAGFIVVKEKCHSGHLLLLQKTQISIKNTWFVSFPKVFYQSYSKFTTIYEALGDMST